MLRKFLLINMQLKKRTNQQNKSLHLYCKFIADAFNDAGMDVKLVLSKDLDHPWTQTLVKELIWRRVQNSYLGKKSTTQLSITEIDNIFDIINKYIGQEFGIHCPFPSIEELFKENNN